VSGEARKEQGGGPLSDVRILELSRVLSGPYLCRVLSDLGADVIKIEPPEGDQSRQIAPKRDRGMSGMFTWANAGKRGLCIDFKAPGAVALVLQLVEKVDAVVENFRPGVADRLGLGWSAIHAANPRAVMVSINGFGSDSSLRDRRAYAQIIHAGSGVLHDQATYAKGPVQHMAQAYGDTTTALHGAVALLSGLREAEHTGVGRRIELAMYDSVLATYTEVTHELRDPPGREDADDTNGLYDAGPHGDIVVAGTPQHVWANLRSAHTHIEDPAPPGSDIPTKARLRREAMCAWMAAHETRDDLVAALEEAGIACSPVETLGDALRGPFGRERDLLVSVDDGRGGKRDVVRMPYRFEGEDAAHDREACDVRGAAPRRGEHNAEVLSELLGVSREGIEALEREGVLGAAAEHER
jgi:crotonobetainyl-CoA:carnitine CoA-transferase CaiB-like acyl-CoA transferase